MRTLTRKDVDLPTLYHYLRTTRLLNSPKGVIPPPIHEYDDYKYLLNIDKIYDKSGDYWGKSIDLIRNAVTRSLLSWSDLANIRRVGIWLSGGFDSALLLKITADILGPEKVRGYHVIWSESKNESEYAKAIADYVGTSIKISRCDMSQIIPLFKESCLLFRAPTWCPQVLYVAKMCAKDGTDKAFIGLGLDALSGGELPQARAITKEEFRQATLGQMDHQRDYIWANKYHAKGYVDLKMPYFEACLMNYMLSLPMSHKVKDQVLTRVRLRDEVVDLELLPTKVAKYGKVAGTKRGFGPDWRDYFATEKQWINSHHPEKYINTNKVSGIDDWKTSSNFWLKLVMVATCYFYELLDEGKFHV